METITVGELKGKFSEILNKVRNGEKVVIGYGRKREQIAVIVPFSEYSTQTERQLGLLKDKASCRIHDNFALSDQELLMS